MSLTAHHSARASSPGGSGSMSMGLPAPSQVVELTLFHRLLDPLVGQALQDGADVDVLQ